MKIKLLESIYIYSEYDDGNDIEILEGSVIMCYHVNKEGDAFCYASGYEIIVASGEYEVVHNEQTL